MRWMGIGGEGGKVGHVGWGRGKRHFRSRPRKSPVKKPEAEVKRSKGGGARTGSEKSNFLLILFGTKKGKLWARTECQGGRLLLS